MFRVFGLGRRQAWPKKRFTAEQIIMKLREAEVVLAQGKPPETTASLGIAGVAQPLLCAILEAAGPRVETCWSLLG